MRRGKQKPLIGYCLAFFLGLTVGIFGGVKFLFTLLCILLITALLVCLIHC